MISTGLTSPLWTYFSISYDDKLNYMKKKKPNKHLLLNRVKCA